MKKRVPESLSPEELCSLIDRYYPALVLFARRRTVESAEDLTQNAFLKLIETAEYRGKPPNPAAWLFRVVRNEAIDLLRKQGRTHSVSEIFTEAKPETPRLDEEIELALSQLADCDRELVEMRIWGGLSFTEIAEITSTPKTTIFRRYESVLSELRHKLE